jgi:uncharacterized protein
MHMPMPPPPDLSALSLTQIAHLVAEKRLPPVESWNPQHCGHSDMRIAADGTWYHQGGVIRRHEMMRLFSTILRREEDGSYVLVTPVEKLTIDVEDAPFVAIELRHDGEGRDAALSFRLNTDELVIADAAHPIFMKDNGSGARPYIAVRPGLNAVLSRPVYYELAHIALEDNDSAAGEGAGVWSNGLFFSLDAVSSQPSGRLTA